MMENCCHYGGILEKVDYVCCGGKKKAKVYLACGKCLRIKQQMCRETCKHYECDRSFISESGVS
jgi:hypothetical protein